MTYIHTERQTSESNPTLWCWKPNKIECYYSTSYSRCNNKCIMQPGSHRAAYATKQDTSSYAENVTLDVDILHAHGVRKDFRYQMMCALREIFTISWLTK